MIGLGSDKNPLNLFNSNSNAKTDSSSAALVSVKDKACQFDEEIKSMMTRTEKEMTYASRSIKVFACICEKEVSQGNVITHIEATT